MKKPVPDPPAFDLSQATTSHTSFGIPDFNGNPLFSIREGICAEDALVHTCLLLNCVRASAYDKRPVPDPRHRPARRNGPGSGGCGAEELWCGS